MKRSTAGIILFSIIALLLYAYGVKFFDAVWSFPSNRPVPLIVILLVGSGIFITVKLGFPQIR